MTNFRQPDRKRRNRKALAALSLFLAMNMCPLFPATGLAETLVMGGTGLSLGLVGKLADAYVHKHPDNKIQVLPSIGSSGGIRALLAGKINLSFSARPLKEEEKGKGAREVAFAKSPFVFAVSTRVRGNIDLSSTDVHKIYEQEMTAWPDGTAIRLILRELHETNNKLIITHFPGIEPAIVKAQNRRGAILALSDQESMGLGESIVGSLITATVSAILTEGRTLKPLSINGVAPSLENLEKGAYPMAITLWAVIGPDSGSTANNFISFIQSVEGATVLRANGALPIAN
jgi:phosphate transport system substrate-binding protein